MGKKIIKKIKFIFKILILVYNLLNFFINKIKNYSFLKYVLKLRNIGRFIKDIRNLVKLVKIISR
jgi:hypothetical protein